MTTVALGTCVCVCTIADMAMGQIHAPVMPYNGLRKTSSHDKGQGDVAEDKSPENDFT